MAELGFGAITEELKILNSGAPAAEVSSTTEAPEPALETSPSEPLAETETVATEPEQLDGQAQQQSQDDDLAAQIARAYPQHAQTFEAFRNRLKEYEQTFGSVKGAREFIGQIQSIGGLEKIKDLRTRKEQVDSVDKTYYGGNVEEKRQFLSNLHKQNPQAFFSAVTNGLSLLTPEERSYIMGPHVTDQLKADLIWQWLEHINEAVQAGLKDNPALAQVEKLLNQFAAGFRKYGLGPARQSEAPEVAQRRSEFHAEIGRAAGESLDSDIVAAINHFAPQVSSDPQRQAAIVDQVHIELQNAGRNDRHLRHALTHLSHAGMSRSNGSRIANLLASKLRPYVPYVVQKLAAEFPAPSASATNGKAAPARNGASARKTKLSQREANQMTLIEIMNDPREGEARR